MEFQENKYHVIRNFLEVDFVSCIRDYFSIRINAGHAKLFDPISFCSYSFYGDPLMETILQNSCESLSKIIGIDLLPSYSYTRLYSKGDELNIHRDRPSCEVSATLALGFSENEDINPIYFSKNQDGSNAIEILLEPGDLCLYRGCELFHWRPPFKNTWYLQTFLHYVEKDGEYSDFIYDKRPYLGFPYESRNINKG